MTTQTHHRNPFRPFPTFGLRLGFWLLLLLLAAVPSRTGAAVTHYVNLENSTPVSPFLDWETAATSIQAAVDAASAGDEIVVSNGVYQTGSRVVFGSVANRVAVTKPVTVRSLNGPAVTVIRGYQMPGTTNGDAAIRCVYLTNGALLGGFTLSNGAVRRVGDTVKERNGGGVWCESKNAVVSNCVFTANAAHNAGGGAYQGTLKRCLLTGNWAASGGGAYQSTLLSSALRLNRADTGGGAGSCTLTNCTLTGNSALIAGGVNGSTLLNSIVRSNTATTSPNYFSDCQLSYSCTTPLPSGGTSNLDQDPQLTDGVHLAPTSPCLGRGSAPGVSGLDIDGQFWANPPAMGCDEPFVPPTGPITLSLQVSTTNTTVGTTVNCQGTLVGQVSAWRWELGDGTVVSNLTVVSHAWAAAGDYSVVLRAYNVTYPTGVTATVTIHVLTDVHYVVANNPGASPPYTSWATAATNIQDAVDAASAPSALVLVSNGVYQSGGRVMFGALTNRLAVTQPIRVQSVNGPTVTVIAGYQVPGTTNGDAAVRCVYLADGAVLAGFTLTNGAVRSSLAADEGDERSGGAVWCESHNAVVSNCVLTANAARSFGGAVWGGTLQNCLLSRNAASMGGGACVAVLNNCALTGNHADSGGGTYACTLNNCTLTDNGASLGGAVQASTLVNSIVWFNTAGSADNYTDDCQLSYCSTTPLPSEGAGNVDLEPQLWDGVHLAAASPCRGRGNWAAVSGLDIDGDAWANPPSLGCDEPAAAAVGPIWLTIEAAGTNTVIGAAVAFHGRFTGQATASRWEFDDGTVVSNRLVVSHAWTGAGDYPVVLRAYNQTYPAGVTTTTVVHVGGGIHYVVASNPAAAAPYDTWATAATNIQDALDATAYVGERVLVSNGVYQAGGRALVGTMSNRVAVTKPVTVESVNGPAVTVIRGYQVPGTTNGEGAMRCVYLTNGAVLGGFTLADGATRAAGNVTLEQSGGGVWCTSTNARVTNCVLAGNWAAASGGGAYSGTLQNCSVKANWSGLGGGGSCNGVRNNCAFTSNSAASGPGGGVYNDTLNNCLLMANHAPTGGGAYQGSLHNCIVYDNEAPNAPNYSGSVLNYSCTTPAPESGTGNITDDPQLVSEGHLAATSPCRSAGSAIYATGVDLDGEPWLNPPSMGCDEFRLGPATGPLSVAVGTPFPLLTLGFAACFTSGITGQATANVWDFGDGTILSNRLSVRHAWSNAGDYIVVLRVFNQSNPTGVAATVPIRVMATPVHYVALTSSHPVPPYGSWDTAAQSMQDALEVAVPGGLILVTNGIYATGGRVISGLMTNRLAVTKPVTVRSVNGPTVTVIRGHQVPGTTNGDGAVRCAYLTNGAILSGFTLASGATRSVGDKTQEQSGGGAWCASTNELITNCVISGNWAISSGGGVYAGTLRNCTVASNWCQLGGGGTHSAVCNNCLIAANSTDGSGGGVAISTLNNCTLTGNSAASGGGAFGVALNNCIVCYNTAASGSNYAGSTILNYCCTTPAPGNGTGNITAQPQLADAYHINPTSPCRGAGDPASLTGLDLDGQPWLNPPSIGCTEYHFEALTNPLVVAITASWTNVAAGFTVDLTSEISGRMTVSSWDMGDGTFVSNRLSLSYAWEVPGYYLVRLTAYSDRQPEGVSATVTVRVVPRVRFVSAASLTPVPPYGSWETAAQTIQEAVDLGVGGEVVVSNGLYASGGRPIWGTLTNRLAVAMPMVVRSVDGPEVTVIQGYQVPVTTNGDGAIRCVYLTNGVVLSGFTLRGGATRAAGDTALERSGGGVWCESTGALLTNCVITRNGAAAYGGGAYAGTLKNCVLTDNWCQRGGGGSCNGLGSSCAFTANAAFSGPGGGVYNGTLTNCTLTGNSGTNGGGAWSSLLLNCIVYYNNSGGDGSNYGNSTLAYCCTTPTPRSGKNTNVEPELASASELSAASPCRGAGRAAYVSGVGLDGGAWLNPPAMGCNEYRAGSVTGPLTVAIGAPWCQITPGFAASFVADINGRTTASVWDFGDGTILSNRPYASHSWSEVGDHTVALWAYNETHPAGVWTSLVVRVAVQPTHYAAAGSLHPVVPYSSWETAAATIQDALNAAAPGALVLVSNGVYATGGQVVSGTMANRVAVTKALTLRAVNGPSVTRIEGCQVPVTTNGDEAFRCVYLTNGAVLSGFTLSGGATHSTGDTTLEQSGGGVWCASTEALVTNCLITCNGAAASGGGAYAGTLRNCLLTDNWCRLGGGGSCNGIRNNCLVAGNAASAGPGGGVYNDHLTNCTVIGNWATPGGGAYLGTLHNCILYFNKSAYGTNYFGSMLNYCCTTPIPAAGDGNITADPILVSAAHLGAGSPCRGAGSPAWASGVDLDGTPWLSPPSIGCDEYSVGSATIPLTVGIAASLTNVAIGFAVELAGTISGPVTASVWDFGDGTVLSNRPFASHAWTAGGDYRVVLRAYNASWPGGLSTAVTIRVDASAVHYVSVGSTNPVPPYATWQTAARSIQDAVDVATRPGALVLVSRGVYSSGGRAVNGVTANRVVVDKPVTVRSLDGPRLTCIQGASDLSGFFYSPVVARCAYLTDGAVLSGFTLSNGSTRAGGTVPEQSGGGIFCESYNALVTNCIVCDNLAVDGGGAWGGTLIGCTLSDNWAYMDGGGANRCVLHRCILTGNVAYRGAGDCYGLLTQCALVSNRVLSFGGGSCGGTLSQCTVVHNLIIPESPCTSAGAGVYGEGQSLRNCIIYYNTPDNFALSGPPEFCCTTPNPGGAGNVTAEPLFADLANGNMRLQSNSPCLNAGNNAYAPGATDLDGRPRIVGGRVDMGAYEFQGPAMSQFLFTLAQAGLPTDGSADFTDPDGDGLNNWQEWLVGTDPTNTVSALRMAPLTGGGSRVMVRWSSVTNRTYFVERSTNLGAQPPFQVLATGLVGQPGTTSFTDTNAPTSSSVFYRVGAETGR